MIRPKILVVDDDESITLTMKTILIKMKATWWILLVMEEKQSK